MKRLLLLLVVLGVVVGMLAVPALAVTPHHNECTCVDYHSNGVAEIGQGDALAAPGTSAKTIALVARMFRSEVGQHVPALTGPHPD